MSEQWKLLLRPQPPQAQLLKLKQENLPCQNQQLCHWASRSQGSVVHAHKTTYLENFSYLKVFINTALQICFTYGNKHSGNDMVTWHGVIALFAWPSAKNHSFSAGTVAFGVTQAVPCSLWYFWALFSPPHQGLINKGYYFCSLIPGIPYHQEGS